MAVDLHGRWSAHTAKRPARGLRCARDAWRGAGRQRQQLHEVSPVERQFFNLFLVDDVTERHALRLDERRGDSHFRCVGHLADIQCKIGHRDLIDLHHNAPAHLLLEARQLCRDNILAHSQRRDRIPPCGAGDGRE